ncbi:lipid transporter ATP-binding/permease [Actinobacillus pleuropneumoniae]|nr:lipid transporter ATP-binding/permease [Actinobacillus pleuropneumoniae]
MDNFKWIKPYIFRYKWLILFATFLMLLESISLISTVGVQRRIIDEVFLGGDYSGFPLAVALFAFSSIGYSVLFVFSGYIASRCNIRIFKNISMKLIHKVYKIPMKDLQNKRSADYLYLFSNDIESTSNMISSDIPRLVQQTMAVLILLWLIGAVLPYLLIGVIPLTILYLFLGRKFSTHQKDISKKLNEKQSSMLTLIDEGISSTREVIAYHREEWEMNRYQRLFNDYYQIVLKYIRHINKQFLSTDPIKWIINILVLLYGGLSVMNDQISIGMLVVIFQFTIQLVEAFQNAFNVVIRLNSNLANVERLRETFERQEDLKEGNYVLNFPIKKIQLIDIGFRYDGENIFDNLNMDIPVQEISAIVGMSGSGKSTISQLLTRFYEPFDGEILINGIPLTMLKREDWISKITIVRQDPYFFPDSIRNNLLMGNSMITDDEITQVCKAVCIHDLIERLPNGYETVVGERGVTLSGGERQRLALARAILRNTEILILDEATSALDMETERIIQRQLGMIRYGKTTIVIAHRLSTIENAKKIFVLHEGRLVGQGSHDYLVQHNELYIKMVNSA